MGNQKSSREDPQREPVKQEYVWGLCGATVVPEEYETDREKGTDVQNAVSP